MSSLTVQYNGSTIQTVEEDKTIALKCAGKLMADDVTLVADGLSSLDVTYNGASILSETDATGTWKLKTSGKVMIEDVRVEVKAVAAYLTFSSPNDFTLGVSDNTKHWDGTLEYSTNAKDWTVWPGTSAISSSGGKLYIRGTGNTVITGPSASGTVASWKLTGSNIRCDGNIETLLDHGTVADGSHPTMAASCYRSMFNGCTSLTTAPSLPATTLADHCYYYMFYGCTSLTTAPNLPATTLATSCYYNMFNGCTKIKVSTTSGSGYSYDYRIPKSGTGTTASNALRGMFTNTGGTFTGTPTINTTYYMTTQPVG